MAKPHGVKVLVQNRKARHNYTILETYEAGIALQGTEVKSIRNGKANIAESYAQIKNGECFIINMHISPYEQGNQFNHDPLRPRRLLLHKKEINRLIGKTQLQGLTLVPLKLYLKDGLVKVEIAVARGKQLHDKRDAIAKRDAERRAQQATRREQKRFA